MFKTYLKAQKLPKYFVLLYNKWIIIFTGKGIRCDSGWIIKEIGFNYTSGLPISKCVEILTCTIEARMVTTFDGYVIDAEVCDHILAQWKGLWTISSMYC